MDSLFDFQTRLLRKTRLIFFVVAWLWLSSDVQAAQGTHRQPAVSSSPLLTWTSFWTLPQVENGLLYHTFVLELPAVEKPRKEAGMELEST